MPDEIVQQKSFQARMKERIRDSIGELLTDEELKKMIDRTMEEVFFSSREVDDGRWNKKTIPPMMHTIVEKLVSSRVEQEVKTYMEVHHGRILQLIRDALEQQLAESIINGFARVFQSPMQELAFSMEETVKRLAGIAT